jgi:hypothetical protein
LTGRGKATAGATRAFSGFSYSSMAPGEPATGDAPDVVPGLRPDETDVWLTQWQIAEEGINVETGEDVHWALISMDQAWAGRLLGNRRAINLQLDTYADATRGSDDPSWTQLAGRVERIDQISMLREQPGRTSEAAEEQTSGFGEAVQHEVTSLRTLRAHDGDIVGWVVRVRS